MDPAELRLRFGDHKRWSENEPLPHLDRDVYEIFVHPGIPLYMTFIDLYPLPFNVGGTTIGAVISKALAGKSQYQNCNP